MNHAPLICSWLGLPADCWPPTHYQLLGLKPGEGDAALIEQHVHSRLDTVRRYQMMHPEPATEAMNRLAQAFVCLTDAGARRAYDEQNNIVVARPAPPPPPPVRRKVEGAPAPAAPPPEQPGPAHVWLYTPGVNGPGELPPPPPVRNNPPPPPVRRTDLMPAIELLPVEEEIEPVPVEPEPPAEPAPPPDPAVVAARSETAGVGLSTRRALFNRVSTTRLLLRLWNRLGTWLGDPNRPLSRNEAKDLAKTVAQVEEAIEDFPLLGEVGQPGYLIVSLTELARSKALVSLDYLQRESLQRDWQGGLRFLQSHRDFLRDRVAAYKRLGRGQRLMQAARALVNENPWLAALASAAVIALVAAAARTFLA